MDGGREITILRLNPIGVSWEQGYSSYILYYAALADSLDVDMFCLGTEFKNAIKKRPEYWR